MQALKLKNNNHNRASDPLRSNDPKSPKAEEYSTPKNRDKNGRGQNQGATNFGEVSLVARHEQSICINIKQDETMTYKITNTNPRTPNPPQKRGSDRSNTVDSRQASIGRKIPIIEDEDIVYMDWIKKESRFIKKWRKRWLVLTKTYLYTFETDNIKTKPTEGLEQKRVRYVKCVQSETDKDYTFTVVVTDGKNLLTFDNIKHKTFLFQAYSLEKKNDWIKMIQEEVAKIDTN